ncbi:MAG: hypothetical protein IT530_05505 [Burkholderiales bacterium]|nr:hypothetical protein [Burkholderiales bacterium]
MDRHQTEGTTPTTTTSAEPTPAGHSFRVWTHAIGISPSTGYVLLRGPDAPRHVHLGRRLVITESPREYLDRMERRQRAATIAAALAIAAIGAATLLAPVDGGVSLAIVVFGRPRPHAPHQQPGPYGLPRAMGTLDASEVSESPVVRAIATALGRDAHEMAIGGEYGALIRTTSLMGVGSGIHVATVATTIERYLRDPRIAQHRGVIDALAELEADDEPEDDGMYGLRPDLGGYIDERQLLASPYVRTIADAAGIDIRELIRGAAGFPPPRRRAQGREGWPLPAVLAAIRRHRAP